MTVLADVVGNGGVTLSIGLEVAQNRAAALVGMDGTGGISDDDTLSFLFDPSSDTFRTMVDDSESCVEKGGVDFNAASAPKYEFCAFATRLE